MTASVGIFEAKTRLSELVERVERGEEVIITRRGTPVARLVPANAQCSDEVRRAIQDIRAFAKRHRLGGIDWKALRDAGRRK